jgi:phosphonate transport system ATP-binding protein
MAHFAHQRVSTLSGGQQQRVAIARALMQKAKVILADEPIASLDPESARIVMDTLRDINQNDGITVVVTLHQVDYALRYCERIVALRQGNVFFDGAAISLITNVLTISTAALTASKRTRRLHSNRRYRSQAEQRKRTRYVAADHGKRLERLGNHERRCRAGLHQHV